MRFLKIESGELKRRAGMGELRKCSRASNTWGVAEELWALQELYIRVDFDYIISFN
jgi:hypothetical protein